MRWVCAGPGATPPPAAGSAAPLLVTAQSNRTVRPMLCGLSLKSALRHAPQAAEKREVIANVRQFRSSPLNVAVFTSLKKIGSILSISSVLISRKLRLFSPGIRAQRAPLSIAT